MRILFALLAVSFFQTGCVKSEQDNILSAVQNYPVRGYKMAQIINARELMIAAKGYKVRTQWQVKQVDQEHYQVSATQNTNAGKSWNAQYVFKLEKKALQNANKKGSTWKMKANNRRTKRLIRLPASTIADWMTHRSSKAAAVKKGSL